MKNIVEPSPKPFYPQPMQDTNDPNVEEAAKEAEPIVQEKTDHPSRKSRLRDRSGQKSGGAASAVSTGEAPRYTGSNDAWRL